MASLLALLFPLVAATAPQRSEKPPRVMFVSIPAIGHLNPTFALAEEMVQRGWQPFIMSFDVLEPHFKRAQLPANVSFVPLPCGVYWNKVRDEQAAFLTQSPDFIDTVMFGLRQVVEDPSFDCFYEHGFKMLQAHEPDLMVVDSSTFVGFDMADKLGIPYVINNPALLNLHDMPYCMPEASYLPGVLSGQSIHDLPSTGASALLRRAGHPLLQLASRIFVYFAVHRPINAKRIRHGFAAKSFQICPGDRLILVEQVFGVEYARPVHPLMHLVGYLERKEESELRLESHEAEWLSEVPVVYVSFGTVFNLTPDQANVLLAGLNSTQFRALWSLKSGRDSLESVPGNVQITHWVSSQLGVLAHPNVKVFISHCGDNSLYESLKMGTPLLCIPIAYDQLDCAMRGFDAGVARVLDKKRFTADDIRREIDHILASEKEFQTGIARGQDLLKLAGGVQRAVDLVEHVYVHGTDHLSSRVSQQYMLQATNLDLWLLLLCFVGLWRLRTCMRGVKRKSD